MPPALFEPLLAAVARDVEARSKAKSVRSHIMMPTGRGTRIVVYQSGMDADADSDLELGLGAGCSGAAWTNNEPVVADLAVCARDPSKYGLRKRQGSPASDRIV